MSDILKMCKLVMKSVFKKPACDMYPVKPAVSYDNTRGHIAIDAPKCILCTLCARKCPTGAITVDREGRKWKIDRMKCILCNACVESCRPKCLDMDNRYSKPSAAKNIESIDIPDVKDDK